MVVDVGAEEELFEVGEVGLEGRGREVGCSRPGSGRGGDKRGEAGELGRGAEEVAEGGPGGDGSCHSCCTQLHLQVE